ncbi:MAG TPA: LLM class F420-dependent oxidoreductase [Candidatus Binataceae bacterium]|nr:LLM class F420-dependent oxidoreductase [Candidatus Binataceae bacterium]
MKLGVLAFLTEQSGNPGTLARTAEEVGCESFFVAEHLCLPTNYSTYYPRSKDGKVPEFYARLIDPFVALAIAASATSRIKLGTGICLLPERNVIATAKATASIDFYSGGRLILGVGAGWFPEEAAVMGVDFKRRWRHLRESVEALRLLWSQDNVAYDGEIIKFPPLKLGPKPLQKPGPPILLGAHDPKHALKRVARYADGWCPGGLTVEQARDCIPRIRSMARDFGRDPAKLEFSVLLMGGAPPTADVMKQYAEAGVSRLVIAAAGTVTGDGVAAVRSLAPVVEAAAKTP